MQRLFFASFLFIGIFCSVQLIACEAGETEVRIVVSPDEYPQEILWSFYDGQGAVVADGGAGEFTFCVPQNECRRWVITDQANDGICCNHGLGFYQIFVDGIEMHTGGDFGSSAEHQINCPPGIVCESALNVTPGLYGTIAQDTWFAFVPSETGEYKASSCAGIPCESILFIYEECLGTVDLTPIGATAYNKGGCSNGNAQVQVAMQAGSKYFIRWHNVSCDASFTWRLSYEGAIVGCMDETACNFNPFATIADTCLYFPNENCPGGLPDLEIDQEDLSSSFRLDYENIQDQCLINEGCASGYGERTILRFNTTIHNIGEADFVIGRTPNDQNENEQFEWDQCHNHWHYEGYASYELYDAANNPLPAGFKNGFCVLDLFCPESDMYKYDCATMGISAGCTDSYPAELPCQWLDITGLEPGEYTLVVKINWDESTDLNGRKESNYLNNYAKVCFAYSYNQFDNPQVEIIDQCNVPVDCEGTEFGTAIKDCEGNCNGPVIMGDVNQDGDRNFEDVDAMVQNIISGTTVPAMACNDLNGDDVLNIIDAYYLYACYRQTLSGDNYDPNDDDCGFPYGTYNNQHTTVLSALGINYEDSYFDVGLMNSVNNVVAFEFNVSGIHITNVSNIVDQEDLTTALNFNAASGKITGYVISDDPIIKNNEQAEFLRIHFDEITSSQICVQSINAILNESLEVVNHVVSSACIIASGIDDLKPGASSSVSFSPNPFGERTILSFPNPTGAQFSLTLFNMNGRAVYSQNAIIEEEFIVEGVAGDQVYTYLLQSDKVYYVGKIVCLK